MSRNETDGSSYLIAVAPCGGDAGGEYTITGNVASTVLTLSMGQSVTDYTKKDDYAQFKVYNSERGKEIFFMLTSLSGDCDLFVSTSPNPTREVHMWGQSRMGSDAITIYPENANYCDDCYYFIGIYGFDESYFSLLATLKDDTPTVLYPGMPQNDHVVESGVNHYAFQFIRTSSDASAESESITIDLTPAFGDPDIFVIVSNGEGEGGNGGRGHPGPFNYDYDSMANNQVADRVVIRTNTDKFNSLCPLVASSCRLQIAITGFHESDFVLLVKTDVSVTRLAIDVPFQGTLARRSYEYFKVSVGSVDDTLQLALTQTAGQSVLFASCTAENPTVAEHEFRSSSGFETTTEIRGDSLQSRGCTSFPADVYIGVYNNMTDLTSSFLLTASLVGGDGDGGGGGEGGGGNPTRLPHGTLLSGDVAYHHFEYYRVMIGEGDTGGDLAISATVASGDVDLYVSYDWENRPYWDDTGGGVKNFLWSSAHSGSSFDEAVTISGLNPGDHPSYIVGVLGTYSSSDSSSCTDDNDFPSQANCEWLVGNGVMDCDGYFCDSCLFSHNCDKTCNFCADSGTPQGTSTYTIVADTSSTIISLIDGVPVTGYVGTHEYKYFRTTVVDPNTDVMISLTPLNGGDPDLYGDFAPIRFPNRTHHSFLSMGFHEDTTQLQSTFIENNCGGESAFDDGGCDIYIGVYGWNHSRFTIMSKIDYGWSR